MTVLAFKSLAPQEDTTILDTRWTLISSAKMFVYGAGGTSANQYHGGAPICSEISYSPYIGPRLSLPAMTRADPNPGIGSVTIVVVKDSHCP